MNSQWHDWQDGLPPESEIKPGHKQTDTKLSLGQIFKSSQLQIQSMRLALRLHGIPSLTSDVSQELRMRNWHWIKLIKTDPGIMQVFRDLHRYIFVYTLQHLHFLMKDSMTTMQWKNTVSLWLCKWNAAELLHHCYDTRLVTQPNTMFAE